MKKRTLKPWFVEVITNIRIARAGSKPGRGAGVPISWDMDTVSLGVTWPEPKNQMVVYGLGHLTLDCLGRVSPPRALVLSTIQWD